MRGKSVLVKVLWLVLACLILSCGGDLGVVKPLDVCNCTPTAPDSEDFRHTEKHVPLPNLAAQDITVATMLTWPQTPVPTTDTPRSGRELKMFHIAHAFVQLTYEVQSDCDIHMEISDSADKNAPRVIVETPGDSEYCPARQDFQTQMEVHGFTLSTLFTSAEVAQPVAVDVLGLAFLDEPHSGRGSSLVGSIWELHPAKVTVSQ